MEKNTLFKWLPEHHTMRRHNLPDALELSNTLAYYTGTGMDL